MAIGDSFLDVMRLNQANQRSRAAQRLDEERLGLYERGILAQEQAAENAQDVHDREQRGLYNNATFNQMIAGGYYNIESGQFDKDKLRTDIENGVPAADAVVLRMAQDKLGMSTPEGFTLDQVTRLPNGKYAFGGDYNYEDGSAGRGVLTKDGTSFPGSEVATFENAGEIANAAELYYKTTILEDGTLAANYPQIAAAQRLARLENPHLVDTVNAADAMMNSGSVEGTAAGRELNGILANSQNDPGVVDQIAADVLDTDSRSETPASETPASETPAGTRLSSLDSVNILLDGSNREALNLNPAQNRELRALVNEYRQASGTFTPDRAAPGQNRAEPPITPTDEERATPSGQARINAAERKLNEWPQNRLAELESELEAARATATRLSSARAPTNRRSAAVSRRRIRSNDADINRITAQIAELEALFGFEGAPPISASVTDPAQQAIISEAENGAAEIPLTSDTAQQELDAYGQTLVQNPQNASIAAQVMQNAGINNLDDAQRADLKSRKMIYAFISGMGATDAQKNAAFSSLMNLGETGVESMSAYQAMQLAQNDYTLQLSAERNRISRLQANNQMSLEKFQRIDSAADWIKENVHDKISEIFDPEGEGKELPSNELAERNLQHIDTDIVPQLLAKASAVQTPEEAQLYLTALMQLTTTYAQNMALIERGGFMETLASTIPLLRGQAQPTFSDDNLANVEVDAYDSNGEPVRFKVTGVAGDTRSEKFSAAKIMGFNPTIGKLFITMIKTRDAARAAESE